VHHRGDALCRRFASKNVCTASDALASRGDRTVSSDCVNGGHSCSGSLLVRPALGISPGSRGGYALVGTNSDRCVFLPRFDGTLNLRELGRLLDEYKPVVALEKSMVGAGRGEICDHCGQRDNPVPVSTVSKVMRSFGQLEGMVESRGLTIHTVIASTWKKTVLLGSDKTLHEAETIAKRWFDWADTRPGKCTTPQAGLVNALCLAEYARRMDENQTTMTEGLAL